MARDASKRREWQKAYKEKHKERYKQHYRTSYAKRREMVDAIKGVPCADCGLTYHPCQMDFDHVRGQKLFNIGSSFRMSIETLLDEIAKCDVVCANCHRLRTHERRIFTCDDAGTGD